MQSDPIIAIAGPTASGKSAVAIKVARLARARGVEIEIISMDSALPYHGMDIGTAKPSPEELQEFRHHGINICEPEETYSAAKFAQDARRWIQEIQARDHIPLIVGGTMLYWRALAHGLSNLPTSDLAIRQVIATQAQEKGWPAMHDELTAIDPETAQRLQKNDAQRISRALEVFRQTGQPMSAWLRAEPKSTGRHDDAQNLDFRLITLEPSDRKWLHQRIEQRFNLMLEQGFMDEMKALHANPRLHPDLPSMRAVGYRQGWEYLDGKIDWETFKEQGIAATRQLAKRQLTWLRAIHQKETFDPMNADELQTCCEVCLAHYHIV
jgi:tRNA dimethylallyltransferase